MSDNSSISEPSDEQCPLRIAATGPSSVVTFHLEAASICEQLTPVAAVHNGIDADAAEPVPGCQVCGEEEIAQRSDIDVVFVCNPPDDGIEIATRMLRGGKHVVVEPSSALEPEQVSQLADESRSADRLCAIWRPYHAEPDFRRALRVIRSGEAGRLRSIRFLQHEMSAAMLPGANSPPSSLSSREQLTVSTLTSLMGHRIAQAIALINEPILSVECISSSRHAVEFGTAESLQESSPDGDTVCHAVIRFEDGITAIIDLGLSCSVSVSTGWIVQGSRGGYHAGRQHITVEDGEIYDVAVDTDSFDPYLNLQRLIRNWSVDEIRQQCRNAFQIELAVATALLQLRK